MYPQSSVEDISIKRVFVPNPEYGMFLSIQGAHPYRPRLLQELLPGDREGGGSISAISL